jgi:polar amino acid transport system substrate-binding protein
MWKILASLSVCTLLLAACLPAPATPEPKPINDKLDEVLARGTLIIATDPDYPPQSRLIPDSLPSSNTKCAPTQYTADQMTGFDVDVAVSIAERLGVEPCFVTPPWSQLIAGNWGDNWDVHVGSVAITYDRMSALYFSQPYFATPTVVLVHQDNTTYSVPEDLSEKRIGICVGCTFESYLKGTLQLPGQEIQYRIQDAQIVGYENEAPAIEDLSLGDGVALDAVITILPVARRALAAGKPLKVLEDTLLFAYASVTLDRFSKRDPLRLLDRISSIIQDLHANGTLKQYSLQYQGIDLAEQAARFDLTVLDQASVP